MVSASGEPGREPRALRRRFGRWGSRNQVSTWISLNKAMSLGGNRSRCRTEGVFIHKRTPRRSACHCFKFAKTASSSSLQMLPITSSRMRKWYAPCMSTNRLAAGSCFRLEIWAKTCRHCAPKTACWPLNPPRCVSNLTSSSRSIVCCLSHRWKVFDRTLIIIMPR